MVSVTDHQMRLYMTYRKTKSTSVAAAKASFSAATGDRIENDPRLKDSQQETEHQGKLILDATVCEQAIRYPTDLSLLNVTCPQV